MAKENKVVSYGETERKVMAFLTANVGNSFTLAEISEAVGSEVASGTIVSLMRKGNVAKGDMRTVLVPKEVNSYGFAAEIPADAAIR